MWHWQIYESVTIVDEAIRIKHVFVQYIRPLHLSLSLSPAEILVPVQCLRASIDGYSSNPSLSSRVLLIYLASHVYLNNLFPSLELVDMFVSFTACCAVLIFTYVLCISSSKHGQCFGRGWGWTCIDSLDDMFKLFLIPDMEEEIRALQLDSSGMRIIMDVVDIVALKKTSIILLHLMGRLVPWLLVNKW